MSGNPVLDHAHLDRYTMGDQALADEVLGLFIAQIPISLGRLRASATCREWEQAAHTIKGSARAVGAWRLAAAAERAEHGSSERAAWAHLAADIEAAADEVSAHIEATAD